MAQEKKTKIMEHGAVQVMDVPCFLARFRDGHGEEHIKVGFIVGEEVRFLNDNSLSKPAQSWLRDDIMKAMGLKDPNEKRDGVPEEGGLERQV